MKHLFKKKMKWADYYTRQAKKDNYPARSIYKLKEIQAKYSVMKKGDKILDLGCAPGSWLIYAAKEVGKNGKIIGIDLKPIVIALPKNVSVVTCNVMNFDTILSRQKKFNSVFSDMAPATTGNAGVDSARSFVLCSAALEIANTTLVKDGTFVCKIFQGEDLKNFSESVGKKFKKRLLFKPKSTRKASREIYVVGLNKIRE